MVSSSCTELFKIDSSLLDVKVYTNVPNDFNTIDGERPFACGFEKAGSIILLPMGGNKVLRFDCNKKIFEEYRIDELEIKNKRLACQYQSDELLVCYRRDDDMLKSDREIVFIKLPEMKCNEAVIVFDDLEGYVEKLEEMLDAFKDTFMEARWFSVGDLVRYLKPKKMKVL